MVRIIGRLIAVLVTGSLLIPTSALAWGARDTG